MAIKIKYEPSVEAVVKLGYSAIAEACVSLCALTFPDDADGHQKWREELKNTLPSSLLEEIVEFGAGDGDYWMMPSNFFDMASFRPYSLEVARARTLSADQIHEVIVEEFKNAHNRAPEESELCALEAVGRDPIAWRDQTINLLEGFQPYFEPIWAELEAAFASAVGRIEQLRKTKPLYEWLPVLDGRIAWDPIRSELLAPGSLDETIDFTPYSEFGVVPSHFASHGNWFYSSRRERKIGCCFFVPNARGRRVSSVNLKVSEVIMDKRRLAILEALSKEAATASELANKAQLSERTVANHLEALEKADLVQALSDGKSGRYRKWRADRDRLRETLHSIELQLLGD